MPLVYVGRAEEEPITDAHGRARKIKPQYTRGELVRVGTGHNLAEAEMIQGILLEEGIPSLQRRSAGFDVPDFLAGGPRDVLVAESARDAARELLEGLQSTSSSEAVPGRPSQVRLLAWLLVALVVAGAIVWLLQQAIS
jgi:hypothetical protein